MFRSLGERLGLAAFLKDLDLGELAAEALKAAGAAVLPADCPCCRQEMGWGRFGVCEVCWEEVEPGPSRTEVGLAGSGGVTVVTAYGDYRGRLRDLMHALKYHGRRRLARPLGLLAADGVAAAGLLKTAMEALVVPVPLSRQRQARRGYNQSDLLARSLARGIARASGVKPSTLAVLEKRIDTPPQAGRSRTERLLAQSGAFHVRRGRGPAVDGRTVLLVDDVVTTGATAGACSRALLDRGAREVIVAAVARTKTTREARR